MKVAKRLLSLLMVAAMAFNFLVISSAAAKPNDYDDYGLNAKVWFEVGREVGGVFQKLQPGENIAKNTVLTVRIWSESDFLAGNQCYVAMFDKNLFAIQGSGKNAFKPNSDPDNLEVIDYVPVGGEYGKNEVIFLDGYNGNRFYDACADSWAGSSGIPNGEWPATFGPDENYTKYTAIKTQISCNSKSRNGGFPEFLEGAADNWITSFKLKAKENIVQGMDARIFTDVRWWRTTATPGNQGYFYKVAAPDKLCSTGISVGLDWQYDFSGADIHLPIPAAPTSTISFNTDGGSEIEPITGDVGAEVPAINAPVKEGYTFMGWNPAIPTHFPVEDLTVTAVWEINKYDITFKLENGNPDVVVQTNHGVLPMAPANPVKPHYNFNGWDPDLVPATQNATYTAKWTPKVYTVLFRGNGGEPNLTLVGTPYNEYPEPPEVTRPGYRFLGWAPDLEPVTENEMEYFALWEEIVVEPEDVTVSFNTGEGSLITPKTGKPGDPFPTIVDPDRVGYDFDGWDPELPAVFPDVDTIYTAKWKIQTYTITFDANGGVGGEVQTVNHGVTPVAPEVTREGYNFLGWDAEVVAATADKTYTAQWAIKTYTITFDANGGVGGEVQTVNHGVTPVAPEVTREGYNFLGWDAEVVAATADKTYTAQWAIKTYTITFDANGGVGGEVQTVNHGVTPVAPEVTREGYNFQGWTPALAVATADATYEAQWAIKTYTITFDANGGVGGEVQTVNHGVTPVAPEVTREGYIFMGWDPALVAATEDATYTAVWEEVPANTSTIFFNTGEGSLVAPITGEVGTAVPAVSDPSREGYDFDGWDPAIPAVFPEENLTVTAKWKIKTYTITFDANGGVGGEVQTVNHGVTPVAPEVTREGYNFLGWDAEVVAATADKTYTAQWAIKKYDITFILNNGEDNVVVETEHGTMPVAPEGFEKEGYTFTGWNPALAVATEITTYEAQWEIMTYTITFDANGGVGGEVQTVNHGVTPVAPEVTREGYNFLGWDKTIAAATEDATYKAQWKIKTYTITFVLGKGLDDVAVDYEYGETPAAPVVPHVAGWRLIGWDPVFVPVTEAATYTAQWEEAALAEYTVTFDPNGGDGGGTVIVTEGDMPTLPADPVREHYIFMGWGNVVPADGDATYKAKWLGDINGDGNITAVDALIGLKHVTGEATLSEDQLALADVNGDGKITALDALILLQFISGKLTELPYK